MNKKLLLLPIALILLSACKASGFMKPPINQPSDDASIKLAEAASSVSESMYEMAKVEKIVYHMNKEPTLAIPNAFNLQTRVSVDWSGPIEELTKRIAKAADYRVHVLGREPSIPVLISLTVKDQSLAEVLRNIDYQAGKKAHIHVYPNTQVIELRYAKIYS